MKKPIEKENECLDNPKVKGVLFVNQETNEMTYSTVLNPHLLTHVEFEEMKKEVDKLHSLPFGATDSRFRDAITKKNKMKATDLMVGNYVLENGSLHEIDGHDISLQSSNFEIELFDGIPLDYEQLDKLGFEKYAAHVNYLEFHIGNKKPHKNIVVRTGIQRDYFSVFNHSECDFTEMQFITRIECVHQLQNLYQALTGKQLKYKEEHDSKISDMPEKIQCKDKMVFPNMKNIPRPPEPPKSRTIKEGVTPNKPKNHNKMSKKFREKLDEKITKSAKEAGLKAFMDSIKNEAINIDEISDKVCNMAYEKLKILEEDWLKENASITHCKKTGEEIGLTVDGKYVVIGVCSCGCNTNMYNSDGILSPNIEKEPKEPQTVTTDELRSMGFVKVERSTVYEFHVYNKAKVSYYPWNNVTVLYIGTPGNWDTFHPAIGDDYKSLKKYIKHVKKTFGV